MPNSSIKEYNFLTAHEERDLAEGSPLFSSGRIVEVNLLPARQAGPLLLPGSAQTACPGSTGQPSTGRCGWAGWLWPAAPGSFDGEGRTYGPRSGAVA